MAKSRDNYQVTGATVEELVRNLNFLFQRLADRMDRIEGIRGIASIESDLDMNFNRVTDVAEGSGSADVARRGDLTELTDLTVNGDLEVDGDVQVLDVDGNIIHSLE